MPVETSTNHGDLAGENKQSPLLFEGLDLSNIESIRFLSVSGQTSFNGIRFNGPEGSGFINHSLGAQNGISDIRTPRGSLLGVFLDASLPSNTTAPGTLDFESIGLEFEEFSPLLKQVFVSGNGETSSGNVQTFNVPTGASRLFLGVMDGREWNNNRGSLEVTYESIAVPEPSAVTFLIGISMLGLVRHRRKKPRRLNGTSSGSIFLVYGMGIRVRIRWPSGER